MPTIPDTPRRLRLRVTLKVMAGVLTLALGLVVLRFLGVGSTPRVERAVFDLSTLAPGEIRRIGWNGRSVIVLHRRRATIDGLGEALAEDPSPAWLVTYDNGTANGCTLVWERQRRRLREICARASWDAAGHPFEGTAASPLNAPPYRVEDDGRLILGGVPD